MKIEYSIKLRDKRELHYALKISSESCLLENIEPKYPAWTELSFFQCANCPLDNSVFSHCPVAVNMVPVLEDAKDLVSHSTVKLTVKTEQRTTIVDTSAQKALTSLMGLVMAASDCPHTAFFRPLAHFHLPVVTQEETIFRALSVFLITEYLSQSSINDKSTVETSLSTIYENLQIVNESFANRIRQVINHDASANAVISLHTLSCSVPMNYQDNMNIFRNLFISSIQSVNNKLA